MSGADPRPPYELLDQLPQPTSTPNDGWTGDRGVGHHPAARLRSSPLPGSPDPIIVPVPGGQVVRSDSADVIARYLSKLSSALHLFAVPDGLVTDATALLSAETPTGCFVERVRDGEPAIWRRAHER